MKFFKCSFVLTAFFLISGCADPGHKILDKRNPVTAVMPDTIPDMNTAAFWISRTKSPDKLILTAEEINTLNMQTLAGRDIIKVSSYPAIKKKEEISYLMMLIFQSLQKELYNSDGEKIDSKYRNTVLKNLNIDGLANEQAVRFGIITGRVSQKNIPSHDMLFRKGNGYFDRMQMSSLNLGTPVAVLGESKDKKWFFVRSDVTIGWIPVESVAFCSIDLIKEWEEPEKFAVSVKYKAGVFSDSTLQTYLSWLPLGSKLPLAEGGSSENSTAVLMPERDENGMLKLQKGYIKRSQISEGYVPYTKRYMLELAFEMLHAPYGWGGMNGNQDCSGFIMQVFNAAGILLPRNSAEQGLTGNTLYSAKTDDIQARLLLNLYGVPGATIIQFPGHIMLYIGELDGQPHVIHAIWSFEEEQDISVAKLPARVVVSNLNLSGHTKRGPYIDRIANIRILKPGEDKTAAAK